MRVAETKREGWGYREVKMGRDRDEGNTNVKKA